MLLKLLIRSLLMWLLLSLPVVGFTQQVTFDIGTPNWNGSFPGAGTYNENLSGVQVTATADRIVNNNVDATAVFSGNDNPAVSRNYRYTFPPGSTVSIDFFHLTNNVSDEPESVGNFSSIPSQSNLGTGHTLTNTNVRQGGNPELRGSATATVSTVSTLTWQNISSLSFDIASNGNVAFIGHRNLVISGVIGEPQAVPALSFWAVLGLGLGVLLLMVRNSRNHTRKKHV